MKRPTFCRIVTLRRASLIASMTLGLAGCTQMQQPDYYNKPKASSETDAISRAEDAHALQTIRPPMQIQIGLNARQPGGTQQTGSQTAAQSNAGSSAVASPTDAGGTPAPVATAQPVVPTGSTIPGPAAATAMDAPPQLSSGNVPDNAPPQRPSPSPQAQLLPEPQTFAGTLPCFHREMQCSAQRVTLTLAPNGRWRARATYLEQNSQSGKPLTSQGCWRTVATRQPVIILLDMKGNVQAEMVMTSSNTLRLRTIDGQAPNLTYNITRQPDLDPIDELNKAAAPNCP